MRGQLGKYMLAGAALLCVGCAVPGPVIVVTEAGAIAADARDTTPMTAGKEVGAPVESPAKAPTYQPPSQAEAIETQHAALERRVAVLRQGVTRVRGRQLVTNAIQAAVVSRVGSLEARIAALEVEFDRRAQRLDSILGDLRDRFPPVPEPPTDEPTS